MAPKFRLARAGCRLDIGTATGSGYKSAFVLCQASERFRYPVQMAPVFSKPLLAGAPLAAIHWMTKRLLAHPSPTPRAVGCTAFDVTASERTLFAGAAVLREALFVLRGLISATVLRLSGWGGR